MKFKVILIVGLSLLSFGITLIIAGALTDGFNINLSEIEYTECVFDSENIDTLDIDVAADDIVIKKSEDDKIRIMTKKSKIMSYDETISGNTLKITQENKKVFFNVSFNIFNSKSYEIAIPDNLLNKLDVKLDAGNLEIKNININECNIDLSAGNLGIENGNINTANISVDAGNVKIMTDEIDNLKVEVDCGNINLNSKITTYGEFVLDLGNLDLDLIGNSNDYSLNSNTSDKAVIIYDVDLGNEDISYVNE